MKKNILTSLMSRFSCTAFEGGGGVEIVTIKGVPSSCTAFAGGNGVEIVTIKGVPSSCTAFAGGGGTTTGTFTR